MTGIDKLPIKDDNEEYLNIKKTIYQTSVNPIPKYMLMQNSIPTYVATPFPPLNFNQTGKICPMKQINADSEVRSSK